MSKINRNKVVLIGDGAVGSSFAFSLVTQKLVRELGIIDINEEKAIGDALDLQDVVPQTAPVEIYDAKYEDCSDADIIVFCAGIPQKPGETRLELVSKNLQVVKENAEKIKNSGFDGILVVASNPVDILTYAFQKFTGLPRERVISSGTSLDTVRFKKELAKLTGVDARSIQGYILGEHGDTSFPVWSHTAIGGMPVSDFIEKSDFTEDDFKGAHKNVVEAAYKIINTKGATYYGVSTALTRIVEAIFTDSKEIMPLGVVVDGEYGQSDVTIGVPAVIGKNGIEGIIELKLTDEEQKAMEHSAQTLKDITENAFEELGY